MRHLLYKPAWFDPLTQCHQPQPFPQPFQPWAGGESGIYCPDRQISKYRPRRVEAFIHSVSLFRTDQPSFFSLYSLFSIFSDLFLHYTVILFSLFPFSFSISYLSLMSLSSTLLTPLFPSSPSLLMYLIFLPSLPLPLPSLLCSFCPPLFRLSLRTAKNQYRKLETYIPRKGIARPHSPNFDIHVSVSDLYIPLSICLFCCRK
jgi:hypothetical protein